MPTLTEDRRSVVEREREQHHTKVAEGYVPKKILKNAGDDVMAVCMDLEQALPTPKLSGSDAFYRRKM